MATKKTSKKPKKPSKNISPKKPASGIRLLDLHIKRAAKNLSSSRNAELEKAKKRLSKKIAKAKKT